MIRLEMFFSLWRRFDFRSARSYHVRNEAARKQPFAVSIRLLFSIAFFLSFCTWQSKALHTDDCFVSYLHKVRNVHWLKFRTSSILYFLGGRFSNFRIDFFDATEEIDKLFHGSIHNGLIFVGKIDWKWPNWENYKKFTIATLIKVSTRVTRQVDITMNIQPFIWLKEHGGHWKHSAQ